MLRRRYYPIRHEDCGERLNAEIGLEGFLNATVLNLATQFTSMFALRLGASASQIGLLASLPQLIGLLFLIPGTLFCCRLKTARLPVELSLMLAGIFYGLAGLAPMISGYQVVFLIIMISLANAPMSLYNVSWQNYFAEIIPVERRHGVFATRTSLTFFAGMFTLLITGIVLGNTTDNTIRLILYRNCYMLALIISLVQLLVLRRQPRALQQACDLVSPKDILVSLRSLFQNKAFRLFCLASFPLHAGWFMAWQLFFLSQVRYFGSNETWNAIFAVASTLAQWIFVPFWSRFAKKHGYRLTVTLGSFGIAANILLIFPVFLLPMQLRLWGWLIMSLPIGFFNTPFLLTAFNSMLEFLPTKMRQLNIAWYTTILMFLSGVMQFFGVRLYEAFGGSQSAIVITLILAMAIRAAGSFIFLWRYLKLRNEADAGKVA